MIERDTLWVLFWVAVIVALVGALLLLIVHLWDQIRFWLMELKRRHAR